MIKISYPEPSFNIKKENGKDLLFDELRRKWVVLTPEEWVRQNFVQYLLQVKNYPSTLVAIEKEIQLGELKKRFDVLVYDADHQPWLMVECKAMDIQLNENVLQQVLRYQISVPVNYIVITNGVYVMAWHHTGEGFVSIDSLPDWK